MRATAKRAKNGLWWSWKCGQCPRQVGSWEDVGKCLTSARKHMRDLHAAWPETPLCRHEGWSLDGNKRTCAYCGYPLPDDPARKPRRVNPLFIT